MNDALRPTGSITARMFGARKILLKSSAACRDKAKTLEKDSTEAAALRGKAYAYREAADLLKRLDLGAPLPKRRRERLREAGTQ